MNGDIHAKLVVCQNKEIVKETIKASLMLNTMLFPLFYLVFLN